MVLRFKVPNGNRIKNASRDELSSDEEHSKAETGPRWSCTYPGCTVQTVFSRKSDYKWVIDLEGKKRRDAELRQETCRTSHSAVPM